MKVVGYAYPWDYVGDSAAVSRSLAVGVDAVAVAASYHACRAASPLHPTRRVLDVPASACYIPVRDEAWRGHRLVPSPPSWSDDADLFALAERALGDRGLGVEAWVVLTHHDQFGLTHPDVATRNAFGDVYPYALCPAASDVREYCVTLVEEIVRLSGCSGVVLEACGPTGFDHASQHDKSEFARWSTPAEQLLSLCFCEACTNALNERGVDVDHLGQLARDGVDGHAGSVEESLGVELADEVAAYRGSLSAALRHAIVQRVGEVREGVAVTAHVAAGRWSTGAFPASGGGTFGGVTSVVANCWDASSAYEELESLARLVGRDCRVGAYLRLDRGWDESLEARLARYVAAGVRELHLYHLGLLSASGLETASRVVEVARSLVESIAEVSP